MSKENIQKAIQEKIAAAQLLAQEYPQYITAEKTKTLEKMVAIFQKMIVKPIMSASMPQGEMGVMTASRMEGEMGVNAPQITQLDLGKLYDAFCLQEINELSALKVNAYIKEVPCSILIEKEDILVVEAGREASVFKSLAAALLIIIKDDKVTNIVDKISQISLALGNFNNIIKYMDKNTFKVDNLVFGQKKPTDVTEDAVNTRIRQLFTFSSIIKNTFEVIKEKAKEKALLEELKAFIAESNKELADKFQAQIDAISLDTEAIKEEMLKIIDELSEKMDKNNVFVQKQLNTLRYKLQEAINNTIQMNNFQEEKLIQIEEKVDIYEKKYMFQQEILQIEKPFNLVLVFTSKDNFYTDNNFNSFRVPKIKDIQAKTTMVVDKTLIIANPTFENINFEKLTENSFSQTFKINYDFFYKKEKLTIEKLFPGSDVVKITLDGAAAFLACLAVVAKGSILGIPAGLAMTGLAAGCTIASSNISWQTPYISIEQNKGNFSFCYKVTYERQKDNSFKLFFEITYAQISGINIDKKYLDTLCSKYTEKISMKK